MLELAQADRPKQSSRSWQNPEGYRFLVPWSNAVLLRFFIRMYTGVLPKSEYRRKAQVDDASRSVVRNIEEGYKRATTGEYVRFISFSQGSLEEVKGDVREMTEDGFMKSKPGSSLLGIGIDLGDFNRSLRKRKLGDSKGNYRNLKDPLTSSNSPLTSFNSPIMSSKSPITSPNFSSNSPLNSFNSPLTSPKSPAPFRDFSYQPITSLYPPLSQVTASHLTYEIFLELINKTDWLLRKLVMSLETKMQVDKKKLY